MTDPHDQFASLPTGIRLCFRTHGSARGEPLLLVAGLGLQLHSWPPELLQALVDAGFHVVTPDNRDAGRSTKVATRPPGRFEQMLARPPAENYSLDDMAEDMAGLLDHLGLDSAHVLGMSMGGMIAQQLAVRHAARVRTLVSVFSTTGSRQVGQPAATTLWKIAHARIPKSAHEAAAGYTDLMRHVGDPTVPGIERVWTDYALQAWERAGGRSDAAATARQIGAIQKSGDRTGQLRAIQVPTLVVHGDADLMVAPSGGRATALAVPGARLEVVRGMRHQIDVVQAPRLAALVAGHCLEA